MSVHKLDFKPGIVKDDTPLSAEGGWIDADKARFRRARPESIGGWERVTTDVMTGIARGALTWPTLTGEKVIAWGSQSNLQVEIGGSLVDITPPHTECVLFNPFTTVNGSTSVTVTNAIYTPTLGTATTVPHGLKTGDTVTFSFATAVGGVTVSGAFTVVSVPTPSTYTITTTAATSAATGGGYVRLNATLRAGNLDGSSTSGFGVGTFGSGTYGSATAGDALPRTWALAQWGEFLQANPSGCGLFEYQPALSYPELVTNGSFTSAVSWTAGTGWAIASGVATKSAGTASNLTQTAPGALTGGYTYRLQFDLTFTAGTLTFKIDGLTYSAPFSAAGHYTLLFRSPANPGTLQFVADSAFAGSIDNVSIMLESKAYRILEAPAVAYGMFVDANRVVNLLATINAAGVFDPLLVRWCDQENNRTWVPLDTNVAGEIQLATGSRVIGGLSTRAQNVIWTDAAAYAMQWIGDATDVYSTKQVGEGCGLFGPLAAVEHGGIVFWMANTQQFFQFGGAYPQIIPCAMKDDVFLNVAANQAGKSFCWVNAKFGEVWFHYPDARDGNEVSRYAIYSFIENHWTSGTFNRSSFVGPGVFDDPIGFGTDAYLYYHEKGATADGGVLSSFVLSAPMDIDDGENLMAVRRMMPEFKGQQGAVSISLLYADFAPDTQQTAGPYVFSPTTEYADLELLARQIAIKISSAASPSKWRLGTFAVEGKQSRAKRT